MPRSTVVFPQAKGRGRYLLVWATVNANATVERFPRVTSALDKLKEIKAQYLGQGAAAMETPEGFEFYTRLAGNGNLNLIARAAVYDLATADDEPTENGAGEPTEANESGAGEPTENGAGEQGTGKRGRKKASDAPAES